MKSYADLSYDEQRAFLGLPDVRVAVVGMRVQVAGRQMLAAFQAFGRAWRGEA